MHPGQVQLPAITGAGDTTNIILPFEEFSVDLEHNLGRANGNCFQRKPGVPHIHDGQIMVRLKKKRFIVLDYSIVPTPADVACAAVTPHIKCPSGAGSAKCTANWMDCPKVGVPVCLFDSNPDETMSLYLRSGLCFTCQRHLNEKRRTQRKRKSDVQKPNQGSGPQGDAFAQKRFRINGDILDLNPDAIIVNGPLDGTRQHGPGYEYPEIISDLEKLGADISQETSQLAKIMATIVTPLSPPHHSTPEHVQIEALYNKAFLSVSKGIFLLSQFKNSFDTAVTATMVAEKATEEVLDSASIADVVASAAAVAAAQSAEAAGVQVPAGEDQASSNMIPLLLAAEGRDDGAGDGDGDGSGEVGVEPEKQKDPEAVAEIQQV